MVELGQRIAGMVDIGVRHRRVFAQHIHRFDVAVMHRVHDLGHGQPLLGAEITRAPNFGKGAAHAIVAHGLIVGQEHRDQPRIRRALHVVLPPQRVQPCAGTADLAGHQRERDQAARIVGAVDVLAHPHAPKDHRGIGPRKGPCHIAQHVGFDTADRGHFFGAEVLQVRLFGLPILGIGRDILRVIQPLFYDHMHDRVEHRHISAGAELKHMAGETPQPHAAWVHHDQLATAFGELLEIGRGDGVVLNRVRADDDGHISVFDLVEGCRHRA